MVGSGGGERGCPTSKLDKGMQQLLTLYLARSVARTQAALVAAAGSTILPAPLATSPAPQNLQSAEASRAGPNLEPPARKGQFMASSEESDCRGALQPGLLVKDRSGVRKRITHVAGDIVYWEYVTAPEGETQEHSTPYEEFADSHFVLPPGSSRGAA